ncbi:MAG: hypothetical protein EOP13_26845, partial [Pseudomonas sp.]
MPILPFKYEPGPPAPYLQAEADGSELVRVGRQLAPARKSDGVVLRRGDQGLARRALNPGGQPWYSPLAVLTALTLRAVFRLALHQTKGLIGSIFHLLGLALDVWSRGLMVQSSSRGGGTRYGPGSPWERHNDSGGPSSDT